MTFMPIWWGPTVFGLAITAFALHFLLNPYLFEAEAVWCHKLAKTMTAVSAVMLMVVLVLILPVVRL